MDELGDYYFNQIFQVVVSKTPKKWKLDETSKEVIVVETPKMVWKISNQQTQNIGTDMATILFTFGDANRAIVRNLSNECDRLTQKIVDMRDESNSMKTQMEKYF